MYKILLILNELWESVSMDFMTQLLEWNGMNAILVVVDQFSKLEKMALIKIIATTFD